MADEGESATAREVGRFADDPHLTTVALILTLAARRWRLVAHNSRTQQEKQQQRASNSPADAYTDTGTGAMPRRPQVCQSVEVLTAAEPSYRVFGEVRDDQIGACALDTGETLECRTL